MHDAGRDAARCGAGRGAGARCGAGAVRGAGAGARCWGAVLGRGAGTMRRFSASRRLRRRFRRSNLRNAETLRSNRDKAVSWSDSPVTRELSRTVGIPGRGPAVPLRAPWRTRCGPWCTRCGPVAHAVRADGRTRPGARVACISNVRYRWRYGGSGAAGRGRARGADGHRTRAHGPRAGGAAAGGRLVPDGGRRADGHVPVGSRPAGIRQRGCPRVHAGTLCGRDRRPDHLEGLT